MIQPKTKGLAISQWIQTTIPKNLREKRLWHATSAEVRFLLSIHHGGDNILTSSGRKLRCDGLKPLCTNCERRKYECEYVSTQRRRGPGKAPKGSRSRKARSEHSGSSSRNAGDPLPSMVPDFESSPDLRPFVSVMSLDTFGYQPPDTCPLYPSHRHDRDPLIMRQHSHLRMSRSREISLEDHSDIHKNQSGS